MNDHPYMPLYFGDVLKQTIYWSGEERALLILLFAAQWWNGPLPLDLSKLSNALQYNDETFRALWHNRIHTLFVETALGYVHEELEIRRQSVARIAGARRAAGTASGKVRRARAEQQDDVFEQTTAQPVRTRAGTNGASVARTPIQSNPIQIRSDQRDLLSVATLAPPEAPRSGQPSEAIATAAPPPPATASDAAGDTKTRPRRRRMPVDHPTEPLREWARANTPHVNFDAEIALLRDHEFRDPHSDWNAVARNWLRRAQKQKPRTSDEHLTRFERHKRRLFGDV